MIDLHLSAFAPRWRFLYAVRIDATFWGSIEYLQAKIKGKDIPVNCQLLDDVVKKYFDGLMNVLKRRDSKKKEAEVEMIFKKSREVLSQVFSEESQEKTDQFLQAMASQEKADATKLEIAIIRNIRKCLPQFTEDVIRSAFKKVYSVKKNQGKGEEELTSLVTSKLLSGPKPKKTKTLDPNEITADLRSVVRIPVKRSARSGGTVRPFQRKRRSRSIPNGVKRRPSVLSGQRPQFLTELWPLVS